MDQDRFDVFASLEDFRSTLPVYKLTVSDVTTYSAKIVGQSTIAMCLCKYTKDLSCGIDTTCWTSS